MKKLSSLLLVLIFLLCSCSLKEDASGVQSASPASDAPVQAASEHEAVPPVEEIQPSYIGGLAADLASELNLDSADGEAAIRTAYRYMVENIYLGDPVGLNVWQYFGDDDKAVSFIENRSISPFLFKLGSCEDFAAATVMLLEAAGFEVLYVAGYTLSVDMVYIDHAWALVRLDGEWYHLDPQLEQNVIKNNLLTYRYYLKSDDDMLIDHKWGESLIAYFDDITDAEKKNIRENYTPPLCPKSYATPKAESVPKPLKPDMGEITEKIKLLAAQSGREEPPRIELNVEPPILVRARHITPTLMPRLPYGRRFLQTDAARLYDLILAGISVVETKYPVPAALTDSAALSVVSALQADYPEYDRMEFSLLTEDNRRFVVSRVKRGMESQLSFHEKVIREQALWILSGIPTGATEFEKALYIHDFLAKNLQYDATAKSENSGNIYGALAENLAYCDGFAKSFHYLCREAGLYSVYIKGTNTRGIEHAWNAVSIDGLWYYVDVTWDRPLRPEDGVYHDYFMVSEDEMAVAHIPMQGQYPELPASPQGQAGYYERLGFFVKGDEDDMTAALAQAFYRQLESEGIPSLIPEACFLEVKVLGDEENYLNVKEHFLKNVFNILKHMETIAIEQGADFQISTESTVRCDFNDSTKVLTFYPRAKRIR